MGERVHEGELNLTAWSGTRQEVRCGVAVATEVWWSTLLAADRALLDVLDATERGRVQSLTRPADQGRSLVGAALLRVAVGEHLRVPPGDVLVDRTCTGCGGPHGRPRVAGPGGAGPHVSVSHSGHLVVVALAVGGPVGVDVQRVADLGEPSAAETGRRARAWVRREATLKVGGGAVRPAVRPLRAPLDGYAAALATLTPGPPGPPADAGLVVRHSPGLPPADTAHDPTRASRPGG